VLRLPRELTFFCLAVIASGMTAGQVRLPLANAHMQEDYGRLPLGFEAAEDGSAFLARGNGYSAQLSQAGALLQLGLDDVVTMKLAGAATVKPVARDPLAGKANYFIGNDPKRWRTNIPTYAKVSYASVYPGIDLVYYGNNRALEYDLAVAPHADPKQILLRFDGAELSLKPNGDLKIDGGHGTIAFHQPIAYQILGTVRQQIPARFVKASPTEIAFAVGRYDRSRPLVIDPQIAYSTYFNNGYIAAIAVDNTGAAYITGTSSFGVPLTPGAFDTTNHQPSQTGSNYPFVTKLSPDGQSLVYSTYLGSNGEAAAIAVDSAGNAYVAGSTGSHDFPTTSGAFQSQNQNFYGDSAFLAKLNPSGSGLVYSTYLGGTKYAGDQAQGVAVNATGEALVMGTAYSQDFPVTPGAYQATNKAAASNLSNIFITKFNASGSGLIYSTYIGGSGGLPGYILGTPWTGQLVVPPQLPTYLYSRPPLGDQATAIALDSMGDAYVIGYTASTDYPTTPGAFQTTNKTAGPSRIRPDYEPFVTKLNPTGTALVYSTYLGGSGTVLNLGGTLNGSAVSGIFPDTLYAIAVDTAGNAYVVGQSGSSDYPVTGNAFQKANLEIGTGYEYWTSVFSELNATGTALIYSTYLGGSGSVAGSGMWGPNTVGSGGFIDERAIGVALDGSGNVYVSGDTAVTDFPITGNALQSAFTTTPGSTSYDVYLAVFNPAASKLTYSTYLGGSRVNLLAGLASDGQGNAYLAGLTQSIDFPITPNAFQTSISGTPTTIHGVTINPSASFVTKIGLNATGQNLILTRSTLTTNPASNGQTTLLATVTPLSISPAESVLTGNVTFYANGNALGAPVPVGNPTTASLTATLAADAVSITCTYSGDAYYAASNCPLQPDFTIALANPVLTVQSGGNATNSATLTSIGGFTDQINVACANVPVHIICKVTPKATKLLAYNSADVTVSIDTAIPVHAQNRAATVGAEQICFLLIPGSLLACCRRRRTGFRYSALVFAIALTISLLGLSGCGEDIVPYKLPAGTYTIPITGTAQSSGTAHTAQFTLIVTP